MSTTQQTSPHFNEYDDVLHPSIPNNEYFRLLSKLEDLVIKDKDNLDKNIYEEEVIHAVAVHLWYLGYEIVKRNETDYNPSKGHLQST